MYIHDLGAIPVHYTVVHFHLYKCFHPRGTNTSVEDLLNQSTVQSTIRLLIFVSPSFPSFHPRIYNTRTSPTLVPVRHHIQTMLHLRSCSFPCVLRLFYIYSCQFRGLYTPNVRNTFIVHAQPVMSGALLRRLVYCNTSLGYVNWYLHYVCTTSVDMVFHVLDTPSCFCSKRCNSAWLLW